MNIDPTLILLQFRVIPFLLILTLYSNSSLAFHYPNHPARNKDRDVAVARRRINGTDFFETVLIPDAVVVAVAVLVVADVVLGADDIVERQKAILEDQE